MSCAELTTGRVDLLAGETRDLTIFINKEREGGLFGDNMAVQFSMRPGDRRLIQWIEPDVWWDVWHGDEGLLSSGAQPQGAMFGMVIQVDWASGSEPTISMF